MLTAAIVVGSLVLVFVLIMVVLNLASYDKKLLPDYIYNEKHTDWLIFKFVPRRWTAFVLLFPPRSWAGNWKEDWIWVEPNWPLSKDAVTKTEGGRDFVLGPSPVPLPGYWSIQSVRLWNWLPRIPCYFTFAIWATKGASKRLYFNIGLKPDVTWDGVTRNWNWCFPEMSLTWKEYHV